MGLSGKRKRELDRLKGQAGNVWDDQKDVLERANRVVREARRQAGNYAREEVSPRVRETIDTRVKPAVSSGLSAAGGAAALTRERVVDDVFPAVSSALGSALALLEVAKDPHVRDALKRVSAGGSRAASKVSIPVKKQSAGPGRYILIGVGLVALAGVAYAAWQTLRADDDLWIDDEELSESTDGAQPS
jgi:hypothetical protein